MCTKNDCWRAKSNQRGGYPFRDVCKTAVYLLEMRPASSVTFENNGRCLSFRSGKKGPTASSGYRNEKNAEKTSQRKKKEVRLKKRGMIQVNNE